ncbi:hypothetical protein [Neobacillus sp. FSL H8-0543]|uniref:hypothetical protein n=1 Tax=Neobacillus sp. FSL H8-0543 TaxID=2954672 RepID=UPI00315985F0
MKLVLFFGFIGLSLLITVFGYFSLKKTKKMGQLLLISFVIPGLILGGSSIWWFFTETDGISQMVGLFINGGALLVIGIINIVFYLINRN